MYCGAAATSYVLYKKEKSDHMYLGTGAVLATTITVVATCSVLLYSGTRNNSVPNDGRSMYVPQVIIAPPGVLPMDARRNFEGSISTFW